MNADALHTANVSPIAISNRRDDSVTCQGLRIEDDDMRFEVLEQNRDEKPAKGLISGALASSPQQIDHRSKYYISPCIVPWLLELVFIVEVLDLIQDPLIRTSSIFTQPSCESHY